MATGVRGIEVATQASATAPLSRSFPHEAQREQPRGPREQLLALPKPRFVRLSGAGRADVDHLEPNAFVLADNLHALQSLVDSRSRVRLIYLDPPYGTGSEFQSRDQQHAYSDGPISEEFIESLRQRLILCRQSLADDGSIYVHIGHQLLGYVKVIMDELFGRENFRNVITRRKCSSKNFTRNSFPNLNDFVLFYTKSRNYVWNQPTIAPREEWIEREYPKTDSRGRYKLVPIHAPGARRGATGQPWRHLKPPPGKHWQYGPDVLEELDRNGEIHWSRNGNPRRKLYLGLDKRVPITDYWADFRDAHHQSIHITGYPTEKNLPMLRMIVEASSDAGDLVVDPFCGSGTTLIAAALTGRRWIGMDCSLQAAEATLRRLREGSRPMGDYVNAPVPAEESGRRHSAHDFAFIADARLAVSHAAELKALAAL